LDLSVDHLIDRSQIRRNLTHFSGDTGHEVHVGDVSGRGLTGDEVENLGGLVLAVAVNAPDALLQPRGVERDVKVHQSMAVCLQVDALSRRIGRHQDPDRLIVRVGHEPQPD